MFLRNAHTQDGRLVELVDFDAELLDQGFLRPFDESEDGVYEEREFPAVEFVLGLGERLVVFVLVLRDRPRRRDSMVGRVRSLLR